MSTPETSPTRLRDLRKYSVSFALRALAMAASAISAIITARLLHPIDRGFLALLVVPVNYVASFAGTGMRQPIAKYPQAERSSPTTSGTMVMAGTIGLVAATAWGLVRTGIVPALSAGALCGGMVLFAFLEALAIDPGQINRVLLGQLAVQLVFIGGAPLLYVLGAARPLPLIALQLFAFATTTVACYRREVRSVLVVPSFSSSALARSINHAVATLALTLLCRIDVFAAVLMLPQAALGQYVVAAAFGEFMAQIPAFAGFVVFAETPRDVSGKRGRLLVLVVRALLFSSFAAAALSFIVPSLLRTVVGSQYDTAARLFVWLLPAYVLASALRVAGGFLAATAETGLLMRISVAGAITMTALVLIIGPAEVSTVKIGLCAAAAEMAAMAILLASVYFGSRYE